MAQIICHHKGYYNVYGTISDSFYFESAITLDRLTEWVKEEYGDSGLKLLGERLERAKIKGTSSMSDENLEDTICCNRAGKDEANLSYKECLSQFFNAQML